jgi:hypothetical protein
MIGLQQWSSLAKPCFQKPLAFNLQIISGIPDWVCVDNSSGWPNGISVVYFLWNAVFSPLLKSKSNTP